MPDPSITLYCDTNFNSPYAMSVFVALHAKGLPFVLETVDLEAGAHLQAPFRDLSLTGRVPLLVHNGFALGESSAIIEYLDQTFCAPDDAPLLPHDPRQRAQARQIQAWLRSDMLAIRAERSTAGVFGPADAAPLSADAQLDCARMIRIAERLIDGTHLFGEWCVADTDLAIMLQRLIRHGDAVPARLAAYANAQWQRSAVQLWLDQARAARLEGELPVSMTTSVVPPQPLT